MDDSRELEIVQFEMDPTDIVSLSLKSTTLPDGRLVYVISCNSLSRATHATKTLLVVYDPESKTVSGRHQFESKAELCSVSCGKALLAVDGLIIFFCLKTFKVVTEFSPPDADSETPTETGGLDKPIVHRFAKFDSNPDRSQFVIFAQDLSSFQLMDFDDDDSVTMLHRSGAAYSELREIGCQNTLLLNGVLFAVSFNEALSYDDDLEEHMSWPNPHVANILVFDLKSGKSKPGHPLVSLTTSHNTASTLLNGFVKKFKFYSDKLLVSNVSDDRMLISTGYANLLTMDFFRTSREVAEHEASELEEEQLAIQLEEEAKIAASEEKKFALAAKYKSNKISGSIKFWKGCFGFLTPHGSAVELGGVFLHLSQVENSREVFLQRGVKVFFDVEYDPSHKNFCAVRARAVPNSAHPYYHNHNHSWRGKRGGGGPRRGHH